jgi:hypothetical protein
LFEQPRRKLVAGGVAPDDGCDGFDHRIKRPVLVAPDSTIIQDDRRHHGSQYARVDGQQREADPETKLTEVVRLGDP